MKWTIVGFKHPREQKSIIYKQGILTKTMLRAIEIGITKGCNLFSIRGFYDGKPQFRDFAEIVEELETELNDMKQVEDEE